MEPIRMRGHAHHRRKVHRPKHSAQVRKWIERAKFILNSEPKQPKPNLHGPEQTQLARMRELRGTLRSRYGRGGY